MYSNAIHQKFRLFITISLHIPVKDSIKIEPLCSFMLRYAVDECFNNDGGESIRWKLIHLLSIAHRIQICTEAGYCIAIRYAIYSRDAIMMSIIQLWLLSDIRLNGVNYIHLFVTGIQIKKTKKENELLCTYLVCLLTTTLVYSCLLNAMQLRLLQLYYIHSLFETQLMNVWICIAVQHVIALYLLICLSH